MVIKLTNKYIKGPTKPKNCAICGKEYKAYNLLPKCHCQICKQPRRGHTKCSKCGILIGDNHIEQNMEQTKNGKIICGTCLQWSRKGNDS